MTSLIPALGLPAAAIPRQAIDGSPIYSVSRLTREIRETLERHIGLIWVAGEISNFRTPASGHCYFTLKDDTAQIAVVMWRTVAEGLKFKVAEGLSVLLQGEVTVYEPRGQYQVSVRRMEPLGAGAFQLAFLQLKARLEKEGLFDPARKRPLPAFPRTIAIVTSPTGAAIQDMLRVILGRCPSARVVLCPVRVQGEGSAREIAEGIALANRLPGAEVLIVGRGGGSPEDLWAFNEEIVARAIAASRVPVISAVGHETDFTISDFVADVRALTPTDAGNRVVPDMRQVMEGMGSLRRRMAQAVAASAASCRERLAGLARHCDPRRFLAGIREREQRLDDFAQRLPRSARRAVQRQAEQLNALSGRIESLSPLSVLRRGYSITLLEPEGMALRDTANLKPGDFIRTRLHRGELRARVEELFPANAPDPKAAGSSTS